MSIARRWRLLALLLPLVSGADPAPTTARWPARVVSDARHSVVVAAPEAGALLAPAGGFVRPGQPVRAGQVLGHVRPAVPQRLRRNIEAQLVDARRDTAIGALQVDRYGITEAPHFDISLPTQTLQILTDYKAAKIRRAQLESSLDGSVAIIASHGGRVLRSEAGRNRQLAAGEALFTIETDGGHAVIELKAIDDGFVAPATAIAVLDDGRRLPLRRIGGGFDAAQRAHVALYAPASPAEGLVVNQRLRLQWP